MGRVSSFPASLTLFLLLFCFYLYPLTSMGHGSSSAATLQKIEQKIEEKDPKKLFCQKMATEFKRYHWGESFCNEGDWITIRKSVQGNPLVWTVFGGEYEKLPPQKVNTTLIFCGVHGDEITPIKFCFDIIEGLKKRYSTIYLENLIVVAPVVNPDAFFKKKPTRTNANGVDINRNFPTQNWKKMAHHLWKNHYDRDPRRNPGPIPLSEPEVVFQINLIKRYQPDKIISVHSPLTMLDYDGPATGAKTLSIQKGPSKSELAANADVKKAKEPQEKDKNLMKKSQKAFDLLLTMSQMADDYRIRQFKTYPGSLGNWAGIERKIPTYTLELPSSDPDKTGPYWKLFEKAIHEAIINNIGEETAPAALAAKKE